MKSLGYLISTASVIMLGAVAWAGTKEDGTLRAFLLAGMVASILGMLLRWLSYREDKKQ